MCQCCVSVAFKLLKKKYPNCHYKNKHECKYKWNLCGVFFIIMFLFHNYPREVSCLSAQALERSSVVWGAARGPEEACYPPHKGRLCVWPRWPNHSTLLKLYLWHNICLLNRQAWSEAALNSDSRVINKCTSSKSQLLTLAPCSMTNHLICSFTNSSSACA